MNRLLNLTDANRFNVTYLHRHEKVEFHHNHPQDGGLSWADINSSGVGSDKGIWAHGDRGSIYRAYDIQKGASAAYKTAEKELRTFRKTLKDGEPHTALSAEDGHILLQILAKSGKLKYEFSLIEERKNRADLSDVQAFIDRIASKIK